MFKLRESILTSCQIPSCSCPPYDGWICCEWLGSLAWIHSDRDPCPVRLGDPDLHPNGSPPPLYSPPPGTFNLQRTRLRSQHQSAFFPLFLSPFFKQTTLQPRQVIRNTTEVMFPTIGENSGTRFSFSLVPSAVSRVYRLWWRFRRVRDENKAHRVVTFRSAESENTVGAFEKLKRYTV